MPKQTPLEVALKEVNRRIVTKEEAKQDFINWIDQSSSYGVYEKYVVDFWKEVKQEVAKL